jgi:hypothetical protein
MTDLPLASLSSCPICAGTGWICEEHPTLPWGHDGCGGAGGPCICNPEGYVEMVQVFSEVEHEKPTQQ